MAQEKTLTKIADTAEFVAVWTSTVGRLQRPVYVNVYQAQNKDYHYRCFTPTDESLGYNELKEAQIDVYYDIIRDVYFSPSGMGHVIVFQGQALPGPLLGFGPWARSRCGSTGLVKCAISPRQQVRTLAKVA